MKETDENEISEDHLVVIVGNWKSVYIRNLFSLFESGGKKVEVWDLAHLEVRLQKKAMTPCWINRFFPKLITFLAKRKAMPEREYLFLKELDRVQSKSPIMLHQYFSPEFLFLAKEAQRRNITSTLTFWGTDLKNLLNRPVNERRKDLRYFGRISCNAIDAARILVSESGRNKVYLTRFPLFSLTLIKKTREEKVDAFKRRFGLSTNKKLVVLGTYCKSTQQHLAMISCLEECKWEGVQFVVPLTYGDTGDLRAEIRERLERSSLDSVVIEDYLSDEDVACLRLSGDVLVFAQVRDQFSASIQEALVAGNSVLQGAWLHYEEWEGERFPVERFEEFDLNFREKLKKLLNSEVPPETQEAVTKAINKLSLPSKVKRNWLEFADCSREPQKCPSIESSKRIYSSGKAIVPDFLDDLPESKIEGVGGEIEYYGADNVIKSYCGIDSEVKLFCTWQHGVPSWNFSRSVEGLIHRPLGDEAPAFVARENWAAPMTEGGWKNVFAAGAPYIYFDNSVTEVERLSSSLLIMPEHTLQYSTEVPDTSKYIDDLKTVIHNFDHVAACVHPSCFNKGYWLSEFSKLGVPVIVGAKPQDRNSLARMNFLMRRFEFLTTNRIGSQVFYGSYSGMKVSVWGRTPFSVPVEDPSDYWKQYPDYAKILKEGNDPEVLKQRFPEFFVRPDESRMTKGIGDEWIGLKSKRTPEELRGLLGEA